MRVGLFHCKLPLTGRKPGGAEIYVARLAEALADAGHEVEAWAYGEADGIPGVTRRALKPAGVGERKFVRQYVAPWAMNLRRTDGLDVLHLFGDDSFFFSRRVPTVRTFLGSAIFESATATSWKRTLDQALLFGLEQLSARMADASFGIGLESETLYRADGILPAGISLPPRADTPPGSTILFVGTWEGRKRGRELWSAFVDEVRPRHPTARLVMVSDHCEPAPGVVWEKSPSDARLNELYAASRVFCLPSAYEGFGIPYLEALSHGLDVVATPNLGALTVLQDTHSAVVDIDRLGAALSASLDRSGDELAAVRERNRARAERYAWPRVVAQHEEAYALAIARHPPRARAVSRI